MPIWMAFVKWLCHLKSDKADWCKEACLWTTQRTMSSTATTLLWSRFFSSAPDLTYAFCWVISLHVNAQHFMLPSMQQEVTTPQPSAVPQASKNSRSSKFPTSRIQIEISWQPENHYKKDLSNGQMEDQLFLQ